MSKKGSGLNGDKHNDENVINKFFNPNTDDIIKYLKENDLTDENFKLPNTSRKNLQITAKKIYNKQRIASSYFIDK